MDLSVIIVNWNSKDYLRKSIASIEAAAQRIMFEIVVIDAASYDGCDVMLRINSPNVRFIQGCKNLGFAKANNEAFREARGNTLLFLNPDTEVEGSALELLYHQLNVLPNAGVVGAKLLNSDRSIQTSCIQAFPNILNQFLDCDALRNAFPNVGMWGTAPLFTQDNKPSEVDVVSGACLMIKRSAFERIEMFSTDYFMYSEDVDLCFKVKEAGWKIYYVPTAVIVHHGGASTSQSKINTFSSVMILESRLRFFRKTRSRWYCWLYRFAIFIASITRIVLALLVWPIYRLRGKGNSIGNAIKKWTARLRWTLGGESWVKNY